MRKQPIGKLDHIGIAVKSVAQARPFWEEVMGAKFLFEHENEKAGYKLINLDLNGLTVELLEPLGEQSFLHKFLATKGEGMHHLTFALPDPRAESSNLKAQGVRVVDETEWSPTSYECFISPRSSHGVLIQLGSGYPTLSNEPAWSQKE